MERYIGIDVHAASCTIAVISQSGRKLKDFPRSFERERSINSYSKHQDSSPHFGSSLDPT